VFFFVEINVPFYQKTLRLPSRWLQIFTKMDDNGLDVLDRRLRTIEKKVYGPDHRPNSHVQTEYMCVPKLTDMARYGPYNVVLKCVKLSACFFLLD